jgi:hypothetical protein
VSGVSENNSRLSDLWVLGIAGMSRRELSPGVHSSGYITALMSAWTAKELFTVVGGFLSLLWPVGDGSLVACITNLTVVLSFLLNYALSVAIVNLIGCVKSYFSYLLLCDKLPQNWEA